MNCEADNILRGAHPFLFIVNLIVVTNRKLYKDGVNTKCKDIKMAFDFIKKYFPIKADSLDKFIEVVEREGGVSVIAESRFKAKNGTFTASVGTIANYEYSTRFQSETPTGRPIIFDEVYGSRFGSERGFVDAENRGLYALKGLLTADERLQGVRQRLPNIETALVGPRGTMDEATHQRMYEDARKHNVTPF